MTVATQVKKVRRDGNGTARTFSFSPMVIHSADELEVTTMVTATGVETVRARGTGATNYILNLTTFPGTGSIDFPAAGGTLLPSTEVIVIRRVLTLEQLTDLESQGPYDAEVQEVQFDKLAMIDLQQQEQLDRSLRLRVTELTTQDAELPALVGNASRFLRVNAAEDGFDLVAVTSVSGTLSSATPERVTLVSGSAGSSNDIARADHSHQAAPQDLTAINVYNAQSFN